MVDMGNRVGPDAESVHFASPPAYPGPLNSNVPLAFRVLVVDTIVIFFSRTVISS